MTFPPSARNYLLKALGGMPVVFDRLLTDLGPNDPAWDRTPDPVRFSLREMIAHLADWEPIWLERIERTRSESRPFLPSVDEGELATLHDYKHQDPIENLARYKAGRAKLVAYLDGLDGPDWDRLAEREFVGPLTMQMLVSYILSHDGYHLSQTVEWLSKGS